MKGFKVHAFRGEEDEWQGASVYEIDNCDHYCQSNPNVCFQSIKMNEHKQTNTYEDSFAEHNNMDQQMKKQYEQQLISQLYQLLAEDEVRNNLDNELRQRVENVLEAVELSNPYVKKEEDNILVQGNFQNRNKQRLQKNRQIIDDKVLFLSKYLHTKQQNDQNDKKFSNKSHKNSKGKNTQSQTKLNSLMSTKNIAIKTIKKDTSSKNNTKSRTNFDKKEKRMEKSQSHSKFNSNNIDRKNSKGKSNNKFNIKVKVDESDRNKNISRSMSKSSILSKNKINSNQRPKSGDKKTTLISQKSYKGFAFCKKQMPQDLDKVRDRKRNNLKTETNDDYMQETKKRKKSVKKSERFKTEPVAETVVPNKILFKQLQDLIEYHQKSQRAAGRQQEEVDFSQEDSQDNLYEQTKYQKFDKMESNDQNGKGFQLMQVMREKQEKIIEQQKQLQLLKNNLKEAVQQQKQRIQKCQISIKTISNYLNELDNNSALISNRKTQTHKKLEQTWNQVKTMNSHISEAHKQNQEVESNISEQKQLIMMYKQVIEQLKSQIKIQKSDRDELKKKIVIVKKNEEAYRIKNGKAGLKNEGIINQVRKSLQKWK